ncbi:hypothetical protein BC829DRAFT_61672 [Chytridium lagenaria]|nr:hypothetical protein BC829DRAFT_61672 [Chytridium lagenaria]
MCSFFEKCNIIEVSGRSYPIEEFYVGHLSADAAEYIPAAIGKAIEIHNTTPLDANPDILVFLPLSKSIEESAERFAKEAKSAIGLKQTICMRLGCTRSVG